MIKIMNEQWLIIESQDLVQKIFTTKNALF